MPTELYLRKRKRRLLDRIARAESRLEGRDVTLPSPPNTPCVEVINLKARREVRAAMFALSSNNCMLCDNARCVAADHLGRDKRPGWVVELAASLSRWRRQLANISKKLKKYFVRYDREVKVLQARIADAEKQLANPVGELGEVLGEKPDTACVLVQNASLRGMLKNSLIKLLGPRPAGLVYLCHRCDNPACVNVQHWFWGTSSDNAKDCAIKGRRRGQDGTHLRERLARWRTELADAESKLELLAL